MNPVNFYMFAKQAASGYISTNQDLNDSIAKIAGREGLSQVQIQRVVELTNHEVNDQLRKTADEKTFTFPLASVDGVLSKLQQTPPVSGVAHVKVAQLIGSFNKGTGEDSIEKRVQDLKDSSGSSELLYKEASLRKEATIQKIAAARTRVNAKFISTLDKVAEEVRELVQVAKHYLIVENGDLKTLNKYACALTDNWQGWGTIIPRVREELMKLGEPFTSYRMATQMDFNKDRDRVNPIEGPKVDVVNGKTTLGKQIKQVHEVITEATRQSDKMRDLDNFKDVLEKHPMKFKNSQEYSNFIDGLYRVDGAISKDDEFSDQLISKLGQTEGEAQPEAPPTKKEKLKAAVGLAAGEAGHRVSDAVLTSAAKNVFQNYTPAAHDPHGRLPQSERGRKV